MAKVVVHGQSRPPPALEVLVFDRPGIVSLPMPLRWTKGLAGYRTRDLIFLLEDGTPDKISEHKSRKRVSQAKIAP